jgi:hypothetical protein
LVLLYLRVLGSLKWSVFCEQVLEVQTGRLLLEITCWVELLRWWDGLGEQDREQQLAGCRVPVRLHQLMQEAQVEQSGTGGSEKSSSDDDDDSADFVSEGEWSIVRVLDFQAVTRPHKSNPLPEDSNESASDKMIE